jgi:hypothetical protein
VCGALGLSGRLGAENLRMLSLADRVAPAAAAAPVGVGSAAGMVSIGSGIGTRRTRLGAVLSKNVRMCAG